MQGVKALVSIGGWTGSRFYSSDVGSAANRTAFVETVVDFAEKYNLDGLDFEYILCFIPSLVLIRVHL